MTAPIIHTDGQPVPANILEQWAAIWSADQRAVDYLHMHATPERARAVFRQRRSGTGQLWSRLAEVTS